MITYGLCQRTTEYDKVQKNDLWLLSMFDARHQNGYANVAWVIARWMKRKGAGTQKESQICCGQFISKIARKCRVLTEDAVRSLSTLIYYRDLDTITLRDFIDSDGTRECLSTWLGFIVFHCGELTTHLGKKKKKKEDAKRK
ncbi:hypothetical protein Tco_1004463 [Tanacetum coccineum]|uniref:Uncharacterized protein n=1 Tax=Tanacetum coccineum TaxID=301880 RepID=A0ABQ5FDC4_9ASTR